MEVRPLSGALGATVHDVELLGATPQQWDRIRAAFLEHLMLFFPDRTLDARGLARVGEGSGEPPFYPFTEGMTVEESRPLLEFRDRHESRPEFTCRHRWCAGTVAVRYNRAARHYARNDSHGHRREMLRLSIAGDRPVVKFPLSPCPDSEVSTA